MANPLLMKLEQFAHFEEPERRQLDRLLDFPRRSYRAHEVIVAEGAKVRDVHLVLSGMAARSKALANGERQLMAFLIPGDLCDVEVFILDAMDHDIVALADTTCVLIPSGVMEDLLTQSSRLTRAMWWSTMLDSAVLREWMVGHGRRGASERLAHLFYELLVRHRLIGAAGDNTLSLPMTQEELGDATGLTAVHVNRVLQELRAEGLVEWRDKILTVVDPERLRAAGRFQANYLHLMGTDGRGGEVSSRAGDLVSQTSTD